MFTVIVFDEKNRLGTTKKLSASPSIEDLPPTEQLDNTTKVSTSPKIEASTSKEYMISNIYGSLNQVDCGKFLKFYYLKTCIFLYRVLHKT